MNATPRFWTIGLKLSAARTMTSSLAGLRRNWTAATSPASSAAASLSAKAGSSIAGGVNK
jgi:hypothetical protein